LVKIKKPLPSLLRAAPQPPELLTTTPPPTSPNTIGVGQQPATPGAGRLKSIGDQ
jgi:hypothetical protein